MNYLKELLESYSKLKCRKLKLLEQGAGGATPVAGNNPQERIKNIESGATGGTSTNPNKFVYGKQEFSAYVTKPTRNDPTGHITIRVDLGSGSKNFTAPYQGLEKYLADQRGKGKEEAAPQDQQGQQQAQEADPQAFSPQQVMDPLMQLQPGMGVAQSEISLRAPEIAQKITEEFIKISQKVDKIWNSLSKELKEHYKTKDVLATRLFGGIGSLEKQVAAAIVIIRDNNGNLMNIKAIGDDYMSLAVSKSINDIIDIISKNSIDDNDKAKLDSLVSYTPEGEIIVLDSGGNEGLIFKAGKSNIQGGVLGSMLKSFEERFKHKIQIKDPVDLTLSKEDNAVQSVFFEDIASILALGSTCKQGMDTKIERKVPKGKRNFKTRNPSNYCSQMIKYLVDKYAGKNEQLLKILTPLAALERSNEDYAMVLSKGDTTLSFLRYLIKNGTDRMYQTIIRIAKHAVKARSPERSISKGQITKAGRRADATEVWSTREQLMKALINSGITEEEINRYGFIKEISIEDAYGSSNKKLRSLDKNYKKGQKVFTLDVSYKHYISLKGKSKTGTAFTTSRNLFLNGRLKDLNKEWDAYLLDLAKKQNIIGEPTPEQLEQLANTPEAKAQAYKLRKVLPDEFEADAKFRKTMAENLFKDPTLSLDVGSELLSRLAAYNNEKIESIYHKVKDLPINAETLSPDGKRRIKTKPFKTLANSLVDQLVKENTYEDIFGKNDSSSGKKEIFDYLKKYVKSKKGETQEDFIIRSKGALATYLKNRKLQKDLSSEIPEVKDMARKYFAVKMFQAGGANDNALLCDYRELHGKENYVFRQNEGFGMLREWLNGSKDYDLKFDGNSYTLYKVGQEDIYINCSDSRIESNKDRENGIQSSVTSTFFSNGLLKSLDKRTKAVNSSKQNDNAGELILEFLNSQKEILTKLFYVISKDA